MEPPHRKLFGRRHGKALRARHQRLVAELLPRLAIPGVAPPGDPDRRPVDPDVLLPGRRAHWLEIGFGGGEHLARQAAAHPEVGLIGCEPFINGVAKLLALVEDEGLENVRVHAGDARDLIDLLPDAAIARVFLLYPDPWPKTRHHARRFMNPENLVPLVRVLAPGAELRLATDIPDYVEHAIEAVAATPGLALAPGQAPDWSQPWPDWPGTRYEAKALRQGRRAHYLKFVRELAPPGSGI